MRHYNKKYNIYSPIHQYVDYFVDTIHTGSRVICEPPPTDTDDDWLCLIDKEVLKKFEEKLVLDGFVIGGSMNHKQLRIRMPDGTMVPFGNKPVSVAPELEEYPEVTNEREKSKAFRSYKKDNLNIILTISPDYFENFNKATQLCKGLNLRAKSNRIMVFDAVLYDFWPFTDNEFGLAPSDPLGWSEPFTQGGVPDEVDLGWSDPVPEPNWPPQPLPNAAQLIVAMNQAHQATQAAIENAILFGTGSALVTSNGVSQGSTNNFWLGQEAV